MKKLSVLFVALAVAASASAAGFKTHVRPIDKKIVKEQVMTKKDIQAAKKASARVISEQPEGAAYNYTTSGRCDYASSGYLYGGEMSGNTRVVFGEGNTVYVRNLLFNSGSNFGNNWVEGTLEGNVLTIPLGQSVYYSADYDADVVLTWGTVTFDGEYFDFVVDDTVTEVTYLLGEDGSLTMQGGVEPTGTDASAEDYYTGTGLSAIWTDDASWSGFCNFSQVLSDPVSLDDIVIPTVITEQPEGDLYSYYRAGNCIYSSLFGLGTSAVDGKMNVVFGKTDGELNGKVYIQNPLWWLDYYNTWVEGTYDWMTGMITIPVGQYLNYYEESEYGVQLMWGSTYVYQDVDENGEPAYYLGTEVDEEAENIYFMIGDDVIELLGSEGDANLEFPENYNATGLYAMYSDNQTWAGALEFNTKGQIVNVVPAVPADPTLPEEPWYDCGDESGFSTFNFVLPTTDIDGNMIDPECISYSIYTDDDQLFTFPAVDYTYDLTEDITEVPYWIYSNAVDFHKGYVYFYRTNAEGYEPLFTRRIGIQAIYTVEVPETAGAPKKAPVVNKSNIVYYELNYDAIESVKAELDVNAPIYNVMGQQMNSKNLPAGVYIQNGRKFIVK